MIDSQRGVAVKQSRHFGRLLPRLCWQFILLARPLPILLIGEGLFLGLYLIVKALFCFVETNEWRMWMKSVLKLEMERKHLSISKIWLLTVLVGLAMNVVIFIQLSLTLLEKNSFSFDAVLIRAVRSYSSQIMDPVMVFITHLGSSTMLGFLLIVGMVWLYLKYKDVLATLCFLIVVAGGGFLNSLLKIYFNRDRPDDNRLIEADGLSFPSGHSMGSMLLYGFLVYLSLRYDRWKIRKAGVVTSLICLIFLIGISRIYLGVHYPSDVFAGFLAGFVWLGGWVIALELAYIWNNKKRRY